MTNSPPNDDSGDEMESVLLSCVEPPRGTDVLAVQAEADPAPIVLGTLTIVRATGTEDAVDVARR